METRVFLRPLLFGMIPLFAGCATLPPDLPPVEVGPARSPQHMREIFVAATNVAPAVFPAEPSPPVPPPVVQRADDEVLRLQVLLDRENFSPGCLDGRMGPQTRNALAAWQAREAMPPTGEIDDALRAKLPSSQDVFTSHVVTTEEYAALRPYPTTWPAKAALDQLAYSTILETLAERYHSTERAIREWNPDVDWPDPPVGATLRVPHVSPAERVRAARIEIHLAGKYLQVFDAQQRLVAHFPCSIARQVEKRPVGELRIVNAAENPNYTFDPELFADDPAAAGVGRRLVIPPGPNNPVGVAWLSLDRPGYGIHGTPAPEDIGKTESHGCFRLANWNARKLLGMISIGLPVFVYE